MVANDAIKGADLTTDAGPVLLERIRTNMCIFANVNPEVLRNTANVTFYWIMGE
jgi:hypothetical protein